jgi:Arc/MetJ-type ribon-helix-helix transcriptional regulator
MQLNAPPDLETLINKRLSSGGYTSTEDVLRRALSAHTEEGYLQAERGELIDGAQARGEIQAMKRRLAFVQTMSV